MPYELSHRGFNLWRRTGKGGGRYYAIWKDERGRPQRKSLDTADREEATDRFHDFIRSRAVLKAEPAASLTVRDLMTRHYENYGRKLDSAEQVYHHTNLLNAQLGHLTLDRLTKREQEKFVTWMKETGRGSSYIARVFSDLRRAVSLAVENEELAQPIRIIKTKAERERVAPVLSLPQLGALWAAAEKSFHGSMYLVLALGHGCAAGGRPRLHPRTGERGTGDGAAPAEGQGAEGEQASPDRAAGRAGQAVGEAGPGRFPGAPGRAPLAIHPLDVRPVAEARRAAGRRHALFATPIRRHAPVRALRRAEGRHRRSPGSHDRPEDHRALHRRL